MYILTLENVFPILKEEDVWLIHSSSGIVSTIHGNPALSIASSNTSIAETIYNNTSIYRIFFSA